MRVRDDGQRPDLDLLVEWEELHEQGKEISAADLCRDCPELTPELERHISALRAMRWLKEDPPSEQQAGHISPITNSLPQPRSLAGRYRLDRLLGEGGFGQVWRAHDLELDRPVAIKMPKATHSSVPDSVFLAEARKVAGLKHPGIVPVYDVGRDEGVSFIVSELIDGGSLADKIRQSRPAFKEAVRIVAEVAAALHYAHQQGFVHRDLKPGNILVDSRGQVYLADFGLAVRQEDSPDAASLGTLPYSSPEQVASRQRLDCRTDLYSLGCVLYLLLTGRLPHQAGSVADLRQQILAEAPPAPRSLDPAIPAELERVCMKCLAKEPSARYSTAEQVARDLAAHRDGSRPRIGTRRALLFAGVGLFVTALAAVPVAIHLGSTPDQSSNAGTPPASRPTTNEQTFPGSGLVRGLTFNSAGTILVLGGDDGIIRLYDLQQGRFRHSFSGHKGRINCLDLRRADGLLASGGNDGEVHLWDMGTGRRTATFAVKTPVTWLGWSGDGKALGICTEDRKLHVWDADKAAFRFAVNAQPSGAWSPDDRAIATYGWLDRNIRLWDAKTGKQQKQFDLHPKFATLSWSPSGEKLAIRGADDGCAWFVDANTGKVLLKTDRAHAGWFERIAWSPCGKYLATGHEHSFIMLWHVETGTAIRNLGRHTVGSSIINVLWSPNGQVVASSGSDRTVRLWAADEERPALHILRCNQK